MFQINKNIIYILLFWVFTSCGYHFSGGGEFPENIKKIKIEIFKNKTSSNTIATVLTNDLIYETGRNKNITITDKDSADAIITGEIKSLGIAVIAHTGGYVSSEKRVTVTVSVKITGKDGKLIWSRETISAQEAFKTNQTKSIEEQNQNSAIVILSKRLAELIHSSITDNF